eukprot:12539585-Ditylum_brightwellii.AAC.2
MQPFATYLTLPPLGQRPTQVEQDENKWMYEEVKQVYDNHHTVQETLKEQVQEAVDDIYFCQIKNKYTKYMDIDNKLEEDIDMRNPSMHTSHTLMIASNI